MKRRFSAFLVLILLFSVVNAQTTPGKLTFRQGQVLDISMETKTTIAQEAMGQSIDFTINATGLHRYTVTNATDDNTTLHHEVKKIMFAFDGMGQKMSFDSDKEKDINGPMGKPVKEMKEKPYDLVIDTIGTALLSFPATIEITASDNRMAMIGNLMKEVLDIVQPPQKGNSSFFKILPGKMLNTGDTWTEATQNEQEKSDIAYAISGITDTTILIDFTGSSVSVRKAEMMGNETTTTLNNKSTGTIILDKTTGIIKEKSTTITSSGNTESTFGTLPVTSKSTILIRVDPG